MNREDAKARKRISSNGDDGGAACAAPDAVPLPFPFSAPLLLCLCVFAVMPSPLRAAPTASEAAAEKAVQVQKFYDQAFGYYKNGAYGKAIETWDEILRLDPSQKTAADMIVEVQKNIEAANARRMAAVTANIRLGRYRTARAGLDTLLENGLRTPFATGLRPQLDELSAIVPAAPDKTKAWRLAIAAVNAALASAPDLRYSYNALRYARELDPGEPRLRRLVEWFESRHPETAKADTATPGMTLLEYKRSLALDHLYGARYHEAIDVLDEVLALEPNDLVALKRLGSAYYSLGLREKAREAWSKALSLTPGDQELQKFLRKLDSRRK